MMAIVTTTTTTVPTRRISFEESLQELPKHFAADGDLVLSHLAASLSAVFPDGEDFFVKSVRHFRDRVEDPQLKREVAGFIGQEAMHGREHRQFNERLAELGYPTKQVEKWTRKGLALRWRLLPATSNLAATAALEHFTATLAEMVLTKPEVRDLFGHDEVRNLFLWHALEESEHKAVAFDVYRLVGGSERTRILTMKLIRTGFVLGLAAQMALSIARDPASRKRGVLRKSLRDFRRSPLINRELWDQLKDYDRKGFHPNDRDTTALVEEWREKLFGETGTLNDKLVGAKTAVA
jgi:predicted metal-dependent hydrolase